MKAAIITIGNEILIGDIVDTNAAWIGSFLSQHDIEPAVSYTVGDERADILFSLKAGLERASLIIVTGGLGPTHDDITKKTIAEFFSSGFLVHQPTRDFIQKIFKKRGIPISDSNLEQSVVPDNCEVLFNKQGTAPGMLFKQDSKLIAVLPGVPYEMKYLMEHEVMPAVRKVFGFDTHLYRHYFQTAGIGESTLSDLVIGNLDDHFKNGLKLAYLPHSHGITLRISSEAESYDKAKEAADPLLNYIRETAKEYIYSESNGKELEQVVGELLGEQGLTIAVAESCTGGLLGSKITDVAGSSAWFKGGIIAYSNELKEQLLGVQKETLIKHGAVSKQTALEMAKNVAAKCKSDIGVATTGIAGPGGGTEEKPVGLVWFGFWRKNVHYALKVQFFKDRKLNKERTALVALDIIRRNISGIEVMPYQIEPEYAE